MDHYEHRSWDAWHRHMTFVFLGQLFLLRVRELLKKSPGPDAAAGGAADEGGLADADVQQEIRPGDSAVLHQAELRGVTIAPQNGGRKNAAVELIITHLRQFA
jgi:hypothetical protein